MQVKKKIPNISALVKKTDYNAKVTEIEGKISSISPLATTAILPAIENRIADVSNVVKKQIMMQKYQILNLSILLQLITINLQAKLLMQR